MAEVTGAVAITTAYVNRYRSGFDQAFQQGDSILSPFVEHETQSSEFDYYDRIGEADEMTEDLTRYGDNPISEIPHDRRRIGLKDYELGKYVDEKDLMRVITDPMNPYSQAMMASGQRKKDDVIFDRMYGTAYTGKAGGTSVTWVSAPSSGKINVGEISKGSSNPITAAGDYTLDAGNVEGIVVAHDYTGVGVTPAAANINLAKLKAIRFTMMRLEAINQDSVLNVFMSYSQFQAMLGIDEVINSDYSVRKNLAEGNVTTFLGFRFIHSERVPVDSNGYRRCLVCLPKAFKLATAKSLTLDLWRDSAKKNIPYMYMKQSIDGSRMWGEVAAEMLCDETV